MFTVYARNINAFPGEQNPPVGEVELFRIPNQDNTKRPFLSMSVSNELGNAGNFEFTVDPESKFADIWRQLRTIIRVDYDGDTIFFGRVLTIDRDMFRSRKVHCEGAYTFFMDSVFEGKTKGFTVTLHDYLQMLIDSHNNCMDPTPEKKIYLGEVPGNYSGSISDEQKLPNETQKFGATKGYKAVKEWLDELTSNYGGFMRIRYNLSDSKLYLDWMRLYFDNTINDQVMSVSSNTVDLSDTTEVNNIFTHIVATGKGWSYADGTSTGGSNKHKITLHTNLEGSLTLKGFVYAYPSEAKEGDRVVLTKLAPDGYYFNNWAINSGGVTFEEGNNSFIMGNADVDITGYFYPVGGWNPNEAYKLTLRVSPVGAGTISSDQGNLVKAADPVKVTATPRRNHIFRGWHVSGGVIIGSNGTFSMPENDVTVTAVFDIVNDTYDH